MTRLELVATGGDPVVVERTPKAYAPRGLGPNQKRWLESRHGIARSIVRTNRHAPDCPHVHTLSAYLCDCQILKEPK